MIYHFLTFYSDAFAPVFPLVALLFRKKIDFLGKSFAVIFLLVAMLGFGLADYLGDSTGNNLYIYNLLPVIFSICLFFFFKNILKNKLAKKLSLFLLTSSLIYFFISYKTIVNAVYFNSNFYIVFSIISCVNCFFFYTEKLLVIENTPVWRTNHFWFVTCLLFYAAASTLVWLFFKPLMDKAISVNLSENEMKYIGDLWKLHNLFFCISCITFTVTLLWKK